MSRKLNPARSHDLQESHRAYGMLYRGAAANQNPVSSWALPGDDLYPCSRINHLSRRNFL